MNEFFEYHLPPGPDRHNFRTSEEIKTGIRFPVESLREMANSKRESWAQMVEKQSDSDFESFNSSISATLVEETPTSDKRRSWTKLTESDENLQKHNKLVVSLEPEPLNTIALMSVADGRLSKVHLYPKKEKKVMNPSMSSKTSTISEFILLPHGYTPESSQENVESDERSSKSPIESSCNRPWWSTRKTLIALCGTLLLCVIGGLIGYFVRSGAEQLTRNNFTLKLKNAKDSALHTLQTNFVNSSLTVILNSTSANILTVVDFSQGLTFYQHSKFNGYCFVQTTSQASLPSQETVRNAIASSSEQQGLTASWLQDWNWQLADISGISANTIKSSVDYVHVCKDRQLLTFRKLDGSQQSIFQERCVRICLPEFGIAKYDNKEAFVVLFEKCSSIRDSSDTQSPAIQLKSNIFPPLQNVWWSQQQQQQQQLFPNNQNQQFQFQLQPHQQFQQQPIQQNPFQSQQFQQFGQPVSNMNANNNFASFQNGAFSAFNRRI